MKDDGDDDDEEEEDEDEDDEDDGYEFPSLFPPSPFSILAFTCLLIQVVLIQAR